MRTFVYSIVFCSLSFLSYSQNPHPIVNYFTLTPFENQIVLDWEIKGGETCDGMKLLHSTDSMVFYEIADFPGICGDPSSPSRYSFTHEDPVALQENHYKVRLGTQGDTEVISLFFVKVEKNGYTISVNSITGEITLYFSNPNNEDWNFTVWNALGQNLLENQTVSASELVIPNEVLNSGLLFFVLEGKNNKVLKGKLFQY